MPGDRSSTRLVDSQPAWILANRNVELAVTEFGAHMAPVTFCRDQGYGVQPYYLSPWQNEKRRDLPPVLAPLRGDFFCLPFGANAAPYRGERHPPHGETASSRWTLDQTLQEGGRQTLAIRLETTIRPGTVRREFTVVEGHNAVYGRTIVNGWEGRTPFAHHAILRLPARERTLRISTSKFSRGRTYPSRLADPAAGEYQWLARDKAFRSLARIPSIFRDESAGDYSALPARPGFCDLFQQFERPSTTRLSWVAVVNIEERWIWFALKKPDLMPGRLFWVENQGRHGSPWNGRNRCLGIEDGCMYFDRGIAESCRPNPINRSGIPTCVRLSGVRPLVIPYIQGAVVAPSGFDRVKDIRFRPGSMLIQSTGGQRMEVPLETAFLRDSS